MIEKIVEFSDLLVKNGRFIHGNLSGYSEKEIHSLEEGMGLKLPQSYRELLRFCGKSGSDELFGFMLNIDLIPTYVQDIYQMAELSNYSSDIQESSKFASTIYPIIYRNMIFFAFSGTVFLHFFFDGNQNPSVFMYSDGHEVIQTGKTLSEFVYQQAVALEELRLYPISTADFSERRRLHRLKISNEDSA